VTTVNGRKLSLSVDHWDGQHHQLVGRSAFVVAFVLANADRINAAPRGHVTFNWDGPALRPELHEAYPHVNTEDP
jgi:hypothetical protein